MKCFDCKFWTRTSPNMGKCKRHGEEVKELPDRLAIPTAANFGCAMWCSKQKGRMNMQWYECLYIFTLAFGTPLVAHKIFWGTWFDDPFNDSYDTLEDFNERNGFK